jgi:hypothetical protein
VAATAGLDRFREESVNRHRAIAVKRQRCPGLTHGRLPRRVKCGDTRFCVEHQSDAAAELSLGVTVLGGLGSLRELCAEPAIEAHRSSQVLDDETGYWLEAADDGEAMSVVFFDSEASAKAGAEMAKQFFASDQAPRAVRLKSTEVRGVAAKS